MQKMQKMQKMKKVMLCLMLFTAAFMMKTMKVQAAETFLRLGGDTRYETSVKISQQYWSSSSSVVLASGESFPDALCATPLAKKYDAPILLTSSSSLSDSVLAEIQRLKPLYVYIVGGTGAVSSSIETQLRSYGIDCIRLSGSNRYETSVAVAKQMGSSTSAAVTSGDNFPDAISIAPFAARNGMPIILSSADSLIGSTADYIQSAGFKKTYIIGGYAAISKAVEDKLPNVTRLYGDDRYSTNMAVIKAFAADSNFGTIYTASGYNYPDALAGSAAAVKTASPVFLVSMNIPQSIKDYVTTLKSGINQVVMLGGTGATPSSYVRSLLSEAPVKVVIDAGHGGYDVGAVGYSGKTYEKDVNLAVALDAGSILEKEGIDVIYTRTTDNVSWPSDVTKDLQARVDIANNNDADYFVAIHCDSFTPNPSAVGTSTYYYGPSDSSQAFAQTVQSAFIKTVGSIDRGIKSANYYVIKNSNMPAILIELGFISSPDEEKLLASPDYQQKCAQGLASGILQYVEK